MANTTVLNANATAKPPVSTAAPIEPLHNDTARLYTYLHPILLLSLYSYSFSSLVADPVSTLLNSIAPLAILQVIFVVTCLPPTGGTPTIKKQKPGEKKVKVPGKLESGLNVKIVVRLPLLLSAQPLSGTTWAMQNESLTILYSRPSCLSSFLLSPRLLC